MSASGVSLSHTTPELNPSAFNAAIACNKPAVLSTPDEDFATLLNEKSTVNSSVTVIGNASLLTSLACTGCAVVKKREGSERLDSHCNTMQAVTYQPLARGDVIPNDMRKHRHAIN
jgi:hypothetical protein